MMKLSKHDLLWLIRRLPEPVAGLLRSSPKLFVAGGYIRSVIANEPVNDIDIFAPSKDLAALASKSLSHRNEVAHETPNAFTIKTHGGNVVQFIHRWTFDTPEACLASFDFTIACAALWYDGDWKTLADDNFYADLAGRRLVYRKPVRNEDAGGSMLRVLKFYQRGYRIPLDSLGAVIARLMSGVMQDEAARKAFESMTEGWEDEIAKQATGRLREVDPMVDPTGDAHLPSSEEDIVTSLEATQEAK